MRYALHILAITLFSLLPLNGQEKFYYAANSRPVDQIKDALLMIQLEKKSKKSYRLKVLQKQNYEWMETDRQKITIRKKGQMRIRTQGKWLIPKIIKREITQSGSEAYQFVETHQGVKIREGTSSRYLPLHLEGVITEFYPNGRKKSESVFVDNQLQSNRNWQQDGSPYIDSIFYSVDQEPEFIPGERFFNSYLLQQLTDSNFDLNEFDDDIIIGWVVMETGNIEGVIPLQGKSKALNQFLVETIAGLPGAWEPAYHDGRNVRFFMSIPINITHNIASFQDVELRGGMLLYNTY